jgi:lysophospholipase L1-like esterase
MSDISATDPTELFEPLAEHDPLLTGHLRPEAMAIGDSIFNGVRSATINQGLALGSPPAQTARVFGWPMVQPDYRRPILFDLEQFLRDGVDLDRLRTDAIANAERWMEERGEWSNRRFFDNIGIAGAAFGDLHRATAGKYREEAVGLLARLKAASSPDFETMAKLWFALNTAFLLNPSGLPELDDLTPLEQVASRKPKRLFVNIGSNEGLFRIGITGNFTRENRRGIVRIPVLAQELAKALHDRCPDVERIYYNLLIRPRTIANLAPRMDEEMFQRPGDGYFETYVGRLAMMNGMSAAQMRKFDAEISETNDKTEAAMRAVLGNRIAFVDTYGLSTTYDGKHYGGSRKVEIARGGTTIRLSNEPLSANIFGFRQGGLFGLDNMHPTRVGYALIAGAMADTVSRIEGLDQQQPVDLVEAWETDTLLQDPPRNWDRLGFLFSLIGDLGVFDVG